MEIGPHLSFNGRCAEAFTFYEKLFGGRIITMLTHGESPVRDQVPPDWHGKILHARLEVGSEVLMGMDAPAGRYSTPQGVFVSVTVPSAAEAERIFIALAEGGSTTMPFQKTFWSAGFGMAVDRFGIPWMINAARPA